MSWESLHDLLLSQEQRVRDGSGWTPPVDLYETDTAYVIIAEVAGVPREDLDISVREGQLTLSGQRPPHEAEPQQYHRIERGHGSFARRFAFQQPIDAAGISADLREGVLTVTVPKAPKPEPRRIKVV